MDFREFPKIARFSREIIVTEKIDGTNGLIAIGENGEFAVGSRTRWITPEQDNMGFARWAYSHQEELMGLGVGYHYGEWWGKGIQRGYGLQEKRFSLFNVSRWSDDTVRPSCCGVVPTLYRGVFDQNAIWSSLEYLRISGSLASLGFMKPEGVVIFHTASGYLFKKTLEKDESPKSLA